MITIDKQSRSPIYEQIAEQFVRHILSGFIEPDSPIPSIRALSVELSVNPNTVQKAYNELERIGLIYSVQGIGSFVSAYGKEHIKTETKNIYSKFFSVLEDLKLYGEQKSNVLQAVETVFAN